ncbi:c-type cytochrome [Hwanghaeella grinnelliae]|uniref:C-type cytochrome n=2 Tax=Hwanghaeella grinnelliae TaxID=2500179 RepID=A0A437QZ97_9PROT|nr:c-type cytochrome [Hwanghaeella grinnelliae]
MLMLVTGVAGTAFSQQRPELDRPAFDSKVALGRSLFFDTNLSRNRTMACATCHDPEHAFTDPRETEAGRSVSLGDDGASLGDRNTPTAAYARFSPVFHKNADGFYVGGQFLDGREADLKGQAGGPPLNPIEMGMPDEATVVERIKENPVYVASFNKIYGAGTLDDAEAAYDAMAESIAAFEQTAFFSPFDSKYDRFLRGEVKLSKQEELGRVLFFSQQFTNCNKCHQLQTSQVSREETFSNYRFHNIGIPANPAARAVNGKEPGFIDRGLLDNPGVDDPVEDGKYKVPTLRNVAVTGPYMHNGVFEDLRTTVVFYNKYNTKKAAGQINPETGKPWGPPEVTENLSLEELEHGPALDDKRIDAIVAFLKTLTDRRYEHLLEE